MTVFVTQSDIQLSGPGLIGSDVAGSGVRRSKRITIGAGLTLVDGELVNSLDLSGYLPLSGGTLTGDLKFTDATYDIGKSGATRPRDGFFSRNLTVGTNLELAGVAWEGKTIFQTGYSSVGWGLSAGNWYWGTSSDWKIALHSSIGFQLINGPLGFGTSAGSGSDLTLYRDAADIYHQRRSTNAQTFRLAETWTSSTSFGALQIKANIGAAYQIGSAIGSAGGTNRAIDFGHWNSAGTFSSQLSLLTSGVLYSTNATSTAVLQTAGGNYIYGSFISTPHLSLNGWWGLTQTSSGGISFGSGHKLVWGSATSNAPASGTSGDIGLARNAAGVLEVNTGTIGTLAALTCSAGTFAAGTITDSAPTRITQAWNAIGTTFSAFEITCTGLSTSSVTSKLFDINFDGVSLFKITKQGRLTSDAGGHDFYVLTNAIASIDQYKRVIVRSDGSFAFANNVNVSSGATADTLLTRAGVGAIRLVSMSVPSGTSVNQSCFSVNNTWISSTSFEDFQIKANAGAAYQIGSAVGSAGGTNRALDFGHWSAAGTFTSALSIASTGAATFASTINTMDFATGNYNLGVGYSTNVSLGFAATALGWTARATHNYAISIGASAASAAANQFTVGDSTNVSKFRFGTGVASVTFDNPLILGQLVYTSGSPTALTVTGAAHTTLTTAEVTDGYFNAARTVNFGATGGTIANQRTWRFTAPTFTAASATTLTTMSTVSISGPPVASTGVTATNAYALNVESGASKLGTTGVLIDSTYSAYTWNAFGLTFEARQSVTPASAQSNSFFMYGKDGDASRGSGLWIGVTTQDAHFGWLENTGSVVTRTRICRDADYMVALRNSTNPFTFRVYGTWTSSTAYETFNVRGKASANFEIGPENGSAGGTLRGLTIGGYPAGTATIVGWAQFRPNASTGVLEAFYLGPIADSTTTGGNARGTNSVDLQTVRYAATQVGSGAGAFVVGKNNTASGLETSIVMGLENVGGGTNCYDPIAIGVYNSVSGAFSDANFALGKSNSVSTAAEPCGGAIGNGNTVSGKGALGVGYRGRADRYGMLSHAAGYFDTTGDAQKAEFVARIKTTDATPTTLMLDGSTTRLTIPSGKTMSGFLIVKGIKSDGSAKARFVRLCDITNVGGTTSLDTPVEAVGTDYNPSGCVLAVTAETATDDLQVNITGPAGETWRWTATFSGLEIAYGT